MTTLQFANTHNLVVFLAKPTKSKGFEQVTNVKVKKVNGEQQLQALVDGKKIVVTEVSVRRELQLDDEEAQEEMGEGSANPTDPHHTPTIIQPSTSQPQKKQKPRKPKRKDTEVPQPSGPTDNVADEAVYEEMDNGLERAATTATSLDAEQDRGVNTPRSDEDSMKLKEMMEFCTNLHQRVLDLENIKTAQAQEIISLKRRVKRLDKKGGSRTHRLKRLCKVGLCRRVESSDEEGLGKEDASKQGRIANIDADIDMFGVHDLVGDEVVVKSEVAIK
ncbi:hypothetical protein Tco_0344059, partial [Tanacetum coccineum]